MSPLTAFIRYFGLSPAEGRILTTLYESAGHEASIDHIVAECRVTKRSVKVLVSRIRDAMNEGSIDAAVYWSRAKDKRRSGYFLTRIGLTECEFAIEEERKVEDASGRYDGSQSVEGGRCAF